MALWAGTEPARVQHGRLPAGDSSGGMWYPRDGGTVSEVASSDSLGPDSLAPDSLAPDSLAPDSWGPDSMGLESARPESARVTVFPPGEPAAGSPMNPVVHSGKKLAVIVVNYAAHGLIEHNLAAARLDHRAVRVVLVDNFSSSQEVQAVTALTGAMGWDLVLLGDNGGFGSGVNAGIEEAIRLGSDCFLLINPDARIAADVVAALHEECRNNPLAMVAPRILASDGKVFFDGAVVDVAKGRIRGLGAVHGAVAARDRGHAGVPCRLPRPRLVAHQGNMLGTRSHEAQASILASAGEVEALGQEPGARVHRLRPRGTRRVDHFRDVEVAAPSRRGADLHRLVGHADVQGFGIRCAVDGDRL